MNEIRLFCPATIANLSCGFDVLGLCLGGVGDEMLVRKAPEKGIRITRIMGADLPLETERNVAGVAGMALLDDYSQSHHLDFGFEIEIIKKIKAGSGIGSSAASAAGAVYGLNYLLGKPYTTRQLVRFAMEGEKLASGSAHADNVAPALLGGFTLVRSYTPLDIIRIDSPAGLHATVVHPQIELRTADARSILKQNISLKSAIIQWGNVGGLIAGLYTKDLDLIGRSLHDEIVEPLRSVLIPEFATVKQQCKELGALGSGISGSGPSIFALSRDLTTAQQIAHAMGDIYSRIGLEYELHICTINADGITEL